MSLLTFKMLFQKSGTPSSILAIALLVAILASMNSIINHINSQAEALSGLVNIGGTYVMLSKESSSITSSEVDAQLTRLLRSVTDVNYVLPQKIFKANLTTNNGGETVLVRGVEDIDLFFNLRGGCLDGAKAKGRGEACVGEILARIVFIDLGDQINLTINGEAHKVRVVGTFTTMTQSDSELIVPIEAAYNLTSSEGKASMIEFTLKADAEKDAIQNLVEFLPKDVRIIKIQQPKKFIQDMNAQTLSFLNLWSSAVYVVVVAASHVVATRLVTEASYDLAMLRALGSKRKLLFTSVLTYMITVALLGSILGLAMGIVGAQMASTAVRWVWPSIDTNPFLEIGQALRILLLTLASSIFGCTYPALRSAFKTYMEQPL